MKKKILCIVIVIVFLTGSLIGCSSKNKINGNSQDQKSNEEVEEKEESSEEDNKPIVEAKKFDSLIEFDNYLEEMYEYVEKATEGRDDYGLIGDSVTIGSAGMPIAEAIFDYELMGAIDEWEVENEEMFNGEGTYEGFLRKEDYVYKYRLINKWNEGYTETINLVYDTEKNTVDYTYETDKEENAVMVHTQFYVDESRKLFMSSSEYAEYNEGISQFVLYYDGSNVEYAVNYQVESDTPKLLVDIIDSPPSSWKDIKGDKEYTSIFTFDGIDAEYISEN